MSTSELLDLTRFDLDHDGAGYRNQTLTELRQAGLSEEVVRGAVVRMLRRLIDERAEELRSRISTPGSGQAMEYQQTQAQAAAALKAPGSATALKYPMLGASIGIDIDPQTGAPAEDVLGVARSVDAAFQLWLEYGAAIRAVRLSAKAAIDAAATIAAAAAVVDAIPWPLPSTA